MGLMYTKRFGGKHAGTLLPIPVLYLPEWYADMFEVAALLLTNTVPDERLGGLVSGGSAALDEGRRCE
jgi:hypothetical protein